MGCEFNKDQSEATHRQIPHGWRWIEDGLAEMACFRCPFDAPAVYI
jgi:hypothetical protein